jgi:uncharacterized membrane protein YkoI
MNLRTMLLIGALIACVLWSMIDNQQSTEQIIEPSQTINELTAKIIALDTSKGGLVTKTHAIEDDGIKKYEISIVNRDSEFDVHIDALTGNILNFNENLQD